MRRSTITLWMGGLTVVLLAAAPARAQLGTDRNLTIFQSDLGESDEGGDRFGDALAACDFDGDGFDDLAIGVPDKHVGTVADAGAVLVTYGSFAGLGLGPNQVWHQDVAGVLGDAEDGDRFGAVLAAADLDDDGFCDLAIGVPGQTYGAATGTGEVHILFGAGGGLTSIGDQVWHQNTAGVPDINETGDAFGSALALGDFDLDGFVDLAIGAPFEDVGFIADAGMVTVLYGTNSGLTVSGVQSLSDSNGEADDRFGFALAAGSLAADEADDLVIGVPGWEDATSAVNAGRAILREGSIGLGLVGQGASFQGNDVETDAATGSALAVGNFDGVGLLEIAVGRPGRSQTAEAQGQANVWDPSPGALFFVTQGSSGILETPEPFDRLGEVVAAGDFDGNGSDDLVVGVPGENLDDGSASPKVDAGVVQVVYGTPSGIASLGNQLWSLENPDIGDLAPASNDRFGDALAAGDFDGDGIDDLAIGVPGATVGAFAVGAVEILYGAPGVLPFEDGFESSDTSAWDETVP